MVFYNKTCTHHYENDEKRQTAKAAHDNPGVNIMHLRLLTRRLLHEQSEGLHAGCGVLYAEDHDRDATYYNNKAQDYLREADYHSRHQNTDKAKTYIRWADEASDKAKLRTRWANEAREKAQLRMKWAREAMEKAKK